MPFPGPFHFSNIVDYMSFVLSLTQMLVFLSFYVMLRVLLSSLVCAVASLFCAYLVSVQVSAGNIGAGKTSRLEEHILPLAPGNIGTGNRPI